MFTGPETTSWSLKKVLAKSNQCLNQIGSGTDHLHYIPIPVSP